MNEQNTINKANKLNTYLLIAAIAILFLCVIELLMQIYGLQQQNARFIEYVNQSCMCLGAI